MPEEPSSPALVRQLSQIYGTGLCPADWNLLQSALAVAYKIRQECSFAGNQESAGAKPLHPRAKAVLAQITDWARKLTEGSGAAIAIDDGTALVCVARSGNTAPALGSFLEGDKGLSRECARSGEIQVALETDTDPRVNPGAAKLLGIRSFVVVPIGSAGRPVGILAVFSTVPRKFTPEDVLALLFLAGLTTRVTAGAPDEQHPEQPDIAMLAHSSSGDLSMSAIQHDMQSYSEHDFEEQGAGSPPAGGRGIPSIALAIVAGMLIGGLGGMLVYRATGNRPSQTPARPATTPAPAALISDKPAIREVEHQTVNGALLVTIAMDQQVSYDAHRLDHPDRVYLDFHGARLAPELTGKTLFVNEGGLAAIRLAQTQPDTVRVVLDLDKRFDFAVSQQSSPATLNVQLTATPARKIKHRAAKPKSAAQQ